MDQCDIIFIHACPTSAAIYYHLQLYDSHCLFCPHSIQVTARELGRNLLHILDSQETKKLAVHFPAPLAATQTRDLLKFLKSRQPSIRVGLLSLPVTPYQRQLWVGWVALFGQQRANMDTSLRAWTDRCLNEREFNEASIDSGLFDCYEVSPSPMQPESVICISRIPFQRNALLINITLDLATFTVKNGLVLNQLVSNLIHAYVASASSPRVILIADEKVIFGKIPNYTSLSEEMQRQAIEERRTALRTSLRRFATEVPIYLCARDYTEVVEPGFKTSLCRMLAWLQHRHHLALSQCLLAEWAPGGVEAVVPDYVRKMHRMSLRDRTYYVLNKWKVEIESILKQISLDRSSDRISYISPERLMITAELPPCEKPLLESEPYQLENIEHQNNSIVHSVHCSHQQVLETWVANIAKPVQDVDMQEVQTGPPSESTSAAEDFRATIVNRMTKERIENYIKNPGSFKRGKDLISTLSSLNATAEGDHVLLSGKAQGTSQEPYNLRITIRATNTDIVYEHGYCSCYVGKEGRCKHVVALLLQFKNDTAKFAPSQSTLPIVDDVHEMPKSSAMEGVVAETNAENNLPVEEATAASANMEATAGPTTTVPRKKKVRRQLPKEWTMPEEESTVKKRKRTTTLLDSNAQRNVQADSSNGQIESEDNQEPARGAGETTAVANYKSRKGKSVVRGRGKKSKNGPSSALLGVDSDSDVDEFPSSRPPTSPAIVQTPPLNNGADEQNSNVPLTSRSSTSASASASNQVPLSSSAHIRRSPVKRLASVEDDYSGTDDEAGYTSVPQLHTISPVPPVQAGTNAPQDHGIDMQQSLFRSPTTSGQSDVADAPKQLTDRPKKKQKLQNILDDLFSL